MAADVLLDRKRAIGGERLVARRRLKVFLRGEREGSEFVEALELRRTAGQFALIKGVVRQYFAEQRVEFLKLQRGERSPIELSDAAAVVDGCRGHDQLKTAQKRVLSF